MFKFRHSWIIWICWICVWILRVYTSFLQLYDHVCWYAQHLVTTCMASEVAVIRSTWWAGVSFLMLYTPLGEQGFLIRCYTQYLVSVFLSKSPKPCQKQLIISFWVCFGRVQNHCFSCPWQWNQRFWHSKNIPKPNYEFLLARFRRF